MAGFAGRVAFGTNDEPKTPVSSERPLPVEIKNQTAFGEMPVAEPTPLVQVHFAYNINTAQLIPFPGNGGTLTNGNDHANMATGTNSNGFASLLTREVLRYNPGQGALARFTSLFTTGVANSEQVIGCGNGLNGFFFGFNNADFGVLRRTGGNPELRTLTVTTGSSTAEDVTITLDGIAVTDVTVTNSGDPTVTAREIADHSYASVGTGWGARVAGNVVTFISIEPTSKSGTYSLSSATTAVGVFSQISAGVEPIDTWIAQTAWNVDKMDGTGRSGMTLDKTKGNVYQIRFQWLGYGQIEYSVEHADTGDFQVVHRIKYGNANTSPSVSNPTFPLFAMATNKGNTSNLVIKTSSMAAFIEGKDGNLGINQSASNNPFVIGNVTTEEPVLTIRNKQVYQSVINQVRLSLTSVTLASNLNDAKASTTFRLYLFARAENGTVYNDISTNSSVVEFDIAAVDFDDTLATLEDTFILTSTDSQIIDLEGKLARVAPGSTIMITAQPSKAHATNEVGATLNWKELF